MKELTGGITEANVWFYLMAVTAILAIILFIQWQMPERYSSGSLISAVLHGFHEKYIK